MKRRWLHIGLVVFLLLSGLASAWSEDDVEEEESFEEDARDVQKLYKRMKKILAEEKRSNAKEEALEFLRNHNEVGLKLSHRAAILNWNYETNLTKENAAVSNKYSLKVQAWGMKQTAIAQQLLDTKGLNATQHRLLKKISTSSALKSTKDRERLTKVESEMTSLYGKAQVVLDNGQRLTPGESGVVSLFMKSRDYDLLAEAWKKWRDVTGKKLKGKFEEMVKLNNKGARQNGYKDYGYYLWFMDFEDPKFNQKVMNMFESIKPLYKELHAYVRYKLAQRYPRRFDPKGPVPAHLFGNVWAQQWGNIFPLVKPYEKASSIDITPTMKAQKWTVHKMFKTAENFFISIGLYKMTPKFWERSMLENPGDRPVECHGSALDFSAHDWRIKMCTKINQDDLQTVHHEMGHIEYYMSYRYQPFSFQAGANSGFHEAIGDTIALSVSTSRHFRKIGLLKSSTKESKESEINNLMNMALNKIAFLPFGLLIDVWRWRVYNGTITPEDYNKKWWEMRESMQGIIPPVKRGPSDFDPGAKYHVASNTPYIRYFASFIMQFQFYQAMCEKSGHTGPLHDCDFYESKPAGHLLKSMLSLGASRPWPEAMKLMTGQTEILLSSIRKYFKPLEEWMVKHRKDKGYPIGW